MTAPAGGVFWRARIYAAQQYSLTAEITSDAAAIPHISEDLTAAIDMASPHSHSTADMQQSLTAVQTAAAASQEPGVIAPSLTAAITQTGVGHFLPPYWSTGTGNYVSSSSVSWTHSTLAGDYVLAFVALRGAKTVSSVTYGGVAMTQLGVKGLNNNTNNGRVHSFGLAGAPAGLKTVTATLTGGSQVTANSVSYQGVATVSAPQYSYGTGSGSNVCSQAVTVGTRQQAVCCFGAASNSAVVGFDSSTGGISRWSGSYTNALAEEVIRESASTTTFYATEAVSINWAGIAHLLSST